jgi:uncharacterized protein (DUF1778 family)
MQTHETLEQSQPLSIRFAGSDRALIQEAARQNRQPESTFVREVAVAVARETLKHAGSAREDGGQP